MGHPLVPSGIGRIEQGERRVDVDDLLAFAVALGVSPLQLLLPPESRPDSSVHLTPKVQATTRAAWAWALGATNVRSGEEVPWGLNQGHIPEDGFQDLSAGIHHVQGASDMVNRDLDEDWRVLQVHGMTLRRAIDRLEAAVSREKAALEERAKSGFPPGVAEFPDGREEIDQAFNAARLLLDEAEWLITEIERRMPAEEKPVTFRWNATKRG